MSSNPMDLLAALGREVVVAFLTWIGVLTALFVVYGSFRDRLEAMARQRGAPAGSVQELLPVGEGPVFAQWGDFVGSYSTFDYGYSLAYNEPVTVVFGQALVKSLTLLFAFVTVATVLSLVGLWVTTRLRPGQRGVLAVPAYLLGILAPIVGSILLLWLAYATGRIPVALTASPATGGGLNTGLLLLVSTVVALPIVGDAVRRAHRESHSANTATLGTLLGPGKGGFGTVEVWGYLLYLTSSLIAVEYLFRQQGLGWYLLEGATQEDFTLVLGMVAGLAFLFVFFSFLRNVVWVIVRYERSDPGHPGPAPAGTGGPPGSPRQGPGGAAAGRRQHTAPQQRNPGGQPAGQQSRAVEQPTSQQPAGGGAAPGQGTAQTGPPPAPGPARGNRLWNVITGNRKVQIGTGLLAVAAVLGFVGALAVPVDTMGFQRPPVPGLTGGILLNTMASLATGLAVALVLAVLLGVLPGLLAGALEGKDIGPGTVLSTVLRIPSDVAVVVPFAIAGVLYLIAYPPQGRTGVELAIGTVTGLVLAGFAFRAVYEAASTRIAERPPNADWIGHSLVAGLARLDFVAAVTLFVAGELVFLGLVPFGPYFGFVQLNLAFTNFSFLIVEGGNVVGVLLTVLLAMAPFALGCYLIGDGLGAISARFRDGGAPAPGPPRSPQSAPQGPAGQGQAPPQGAQGQPPQGQQQRTQPRRNQPQQGHPPQDQSQHGNSPQGQPSRDQPPQGGSQQNQQPRGGAGPQQNQQPRGQAGPQQGQPPQQQPTDQGPPRQPSEPTQPDQRSPQDQPTQQPGQHEPEQSPAESQQSDRGRGRKDDEGDANAGE